MKGDNNTGVEEITRESLIAHVVAVIKKNKDKKLYDKLSKLMADSRI